MKLLAGGDDGKCWVGFAGPLVMTCFLTYIKRKWDLPLGWSENLALANWVEDM